MKSKQILQLKCHSQLSRRFANRCHLAPFVWQADGGAEFRTFLHLLESQLPLESVSHLSELDMARRFYYASDGVVAYVMKLIRYGTYLALQQEREQLDLSILAAAFEKYVHADKTDKVNPFISDEFELQSKETQSKETQSKEVTIGATNNRLKSKPKKLKAVEVLTTK